MRLDRTERSYVFRYPGASSRSSVPVDAQWEIRGGQFHNHRKQSAVSAGFAMICHVHHVPPDEHVFGVGRFFVPLRTRMGRFPFLRTWKRLLKNSGCRPKCVKPESSHHRVTRSFYPFPPPLHISLDCRFFLETFRIHVLRKPAQATDSSNPVPSPTATDGPHPTMHWSTSRGLETRQSSPICHGKASQDPHTRSHESGRLSPGFSHYGHPPPIADSEQTSSKPSLLYPCS